MKNYIGAQRVDDPKAYVANVSTVLLNYPESIAKRVADPFRGIASECKWYPNLAELKAFCERAMQPLREAAEREARHADTRLLLTPPTASPEERERAFQRWMRDIRPELETPPLTPRRREKTMEEVLAEPLPPLSAEARRVFAADVCGND